MVLGGMMQSEDIGSFEGLVHATAARYDGYLADLDLDDIKQRLRIKVWYAVERFDSDRTSRRAIGRSELEEQRKAFVFSAVRNMVKDLLKEQARLNRRRGGGALHVEDTPGHVTAEAFEGRYLAVEAEQAFASVEDEDVTLPWTLTDLERAVVRLLALDYNQTEVAGKLGVSRQKVRSAHESVQVKMADWRPSPPVSQPAILAA